MGEINRITWQSISNKDQQDAAALLLSARQHFAEQGDKGFNVGTRLLDHVEANRKKALAEEEQLNTEFINQQLRSARTPEELAAVQQNFSPEEIAKSFGTHYDLAKTNAAYNNAPVDMARNWTIDDNNKDLNANTVKAKQDLALGIQTGNRNLVRNAQDRLNHYASLRTVGDTAATAGQTYAQTSNNWTLNPNNVGAQDRIAELTRNGDFVGLQHVIDTSRDPEERQRALMQMNAAGAISEQRSKDLTNRQNAYNQQLHQLDEQYTAEAEKIASEEAHVRSLREPNAEEISGWNKRLRDAEARRAWGRNQAYEILNPKNNTSWDIYKFGKAPLEGYQAAKGSSPLYNSSGRINQSKMFMDEKSNLLPGVYTPKPGTSWTPQDDGATVQSPLAFKSKEAAATREQQYIDLYRRSGQFAEHMDTWHTKAFKMFGDYDMAAAFTLMAGMESKYDVDAKSPKSTAKGLMQIIDSTRDSLMPKAKKLAKQRNISVDEALQYVAFEDSWKTAKRLGLINDNMSMEEMTIGTEIAHMFGAGSAAKIARLSENDNLFNNGITDKQLNNNNLDRTNTKADLLKKMNGFFGFPDRDKPNVSPQAQGKIDDILAQNATPAPQSPLGPVYEEPQQQYNWGANADSPWVGETTSPEVKANANAATAALAPTTQDTADALKSQGSQTLNAQDSAIDKATSAFINQASEGDMVGARQALQAVLSPQAKGDNLWNASTNQVSVEGQDKIIQAALATMDKSSGVLNPENLPKGMDPDTAVQLRALYTPNKFKAKEIQSLFQNPEEYLAKKGITPKYKNKLDEARLSVARSVGMKLTDPELRNIYMSSDFLKVIDPVTAPQDMPLDAPNGARLYDPSQADSGITEENADAIWDMFRDEESWFYFRPGTREAFTQFAMKDPKSAVAMLRQIHATSQEGSKEPGKLGHSKYSSEVYDKIFNMSRLYTQLGKNGLQRLQDLQRGMKESVQETMSNPDTAIKIAKYIQANGFNKQGVQDIVDASKTNQFADRASKAVNYGVLGKEAEAELMKVVRKFSTRRDKSPVTKKDFKTIIKYASQMANGAQLQKSDDDEAFREVLNTILTYDGNYPVLPPGTTWGNSYGNPIRNNVHNVLSQHRRANLPSYK